MKQQLDRIKNREVILKKDETKKIDYAKTLANLITNGNVEEYLLKNNLYKT